jgi:hypothetical protein
MTVDEPVQDPRRTELVGGPPQPGAPGARMPWAAAPGAPDQKAAPAPAAPQAPAIPPGWHPDPSDPQGAVRWWDGWQWTAYSQPVQPQPAQPPVPAAPGDPNGLYRLTIAKVTSVIILTSRRSVTYTGTYEQLRKAYKSVLVYNLLLGWWGFPFGLIWTPMTLVRNAGALKKLKGLAGGG